MTSILCWHLQRHQEEKCAPRTGFGRARCALARSAMGCLIAAILAVLMAPTPARSQSAGNVLLESNEQLFCVLAALNAAGYDAGVGSSGAGDTRRMVREYLEAQNAPVLPELKKFYADHRVKDDPSRDLGQYISLALLVASPPDFKMTVADAEVPPDARDVAGFLPLLRKFYAQTKMLNLWSQVQKQYDAAAGHLGCLCAARHRAGPPGLPA